MIKYTVTLETLKSKNHIVGDIERSVATFERGGVEFDEQEPRHYLVAKVPHKKIDTKTVTVTFSCDGCDLEHHYCS